MMPKRSVLDRAEVGVGTLIVFIAMVLVAAVAAAVLVNTTGALQQRAQATGAAATQDVASNLKLVAVYGVRNTTSADVSSLQIQVQLAAGSSPVDITTALIRFSDGTRVVNYPYGSPGFSTTWVRGTNSSGVMRSGDLVEISIDLGTLLAPRTEVQLLIVPEIGSPVDVGFHAPPTYGANTKVTLR